MDSTKAEVLERVRFEQGMCGDTRKDERDKIAGAIRRAVKAEGERISDIRSARISSKKDQKGTSKATKR